MQISDRIKSIKPSLTLAMNAKALELKEQGVMVTSLAVGEPDFPTPKHICEAAKAAIDSNFCRYTAVPGIMELRKAVCGYYSNQYDLTIGPENVIISNGGRKAITPKTKLFILNSPCNPTGAVYSAEELKGIMDVVIGAGLNVFSDEVYDQLVFAPAEMASASPYFAKYPEQVSILCGLSKSFAMTGWRVGFLVAHKDIIKKCSTLQGQSTSNICSIAQKAALAALTGPMDCVREMREAFSRRRNMALSIIDTWKFAVCPHPDGAFYLFIDVHKCFGGKVHDSLELSRYLLERLHIATTPGVAFGNDNCIRLSYAVSDDALKKALTEMGEVLAELADEA